MKPVNTSTNISSAKRLVLVAVSFAVPVVLGQTSVFAQTPSANGHWEINSYDRDGVDHGPGNDWWNFWGTKNPDYKWQNDDCLPYGCYSVRQDAANSQWTRFLYGVPFVRGGAWAYHKGSVTPWIFWQSDKDVTGAPKPNSQPPKVFWYREDSGMGAWGTLSSTLDADNGLGSPTATGVQLGTSLLFYFTSQGAKVNKTLNYARKSAIPLSTRNLSAEAKVLPSTTDPFETHVYTDMLYSAKPVNYNLWSDIEPSYFRRPAVAGSGFVQWSHDLPWPGHPDEWDWVNEPDRKKLDTVAEYAAPVNNVVLQTPHPDFPAGFYALSPSSIWGSFWVDQNAIDYPNYVWTINGGTSDLKGKAATRGGSWTLDITPHPDDTKWTTSSGEKVSYQGMPGSALYLGATLTAPVTKTIKVVTSDGPQNQITGYADVTWHLPIENRHCAWNASGIIKNTNPDGSASGPDYENLGVISLDTGFAAFPDHSFEKDFNWGLSNKIAGYVVSAGGYIIQIWTEASQPWYALLAVGLQLNGLRLTEQKPPTPVITPKSAVSDYEAYKKAVLSQGTVGNYVIGHRSPKYIGNPAFADIAVAQASFIPGNQHNPGTGLVDNEATNVKVSGWMVFNHVVKKYEGDSYDIHGYQGVESGIETNRDNPAYEVTFTDPDYIPTT